MFGLDGAIFVPGVDDLAFHGPPCLAGKRDHTEPFAGDSGLESEFLGKRDLREDAEESVEECERLAGVGALVDELSEFGGGHACERFEDADVELLTVADESEEAGGVVGFDGLLEFFGDGAGE